MYAVIQLGSIQYKVSKGDTIKAQLLKMKDNSTFNVDKVLMFADGNSIKIGQPYLKDVKVEAKIESRILDEKKTSFKFRRRKNSKNTRGHRQVLNSVTIVDIKAGV